MEVKSLARWRLLASVVCERFIINEYISVERLTQNTSVATKTEYVNSDLIAFKDWTRKGS